MEVAPFERRVVVVAPGGALDYDRADWLDAIVAVESGQVELAAAGGERHSFRAGAVVCLSGLRCRNPGPAPAVLLAVWRRR